MGKGKGERGRNWEEEKGSFDWDLKTKDKKANQQIIKNFRRIR